MNQFKIFQNDKFGQVRTVNVDGEVFFVAIDVAKALGYKDASKAIKQHCRWGAKCPIPHPQNPEKQIEVNAIPKGDIYRLVAGSTLPGAADFESWIFDEVLISIGKHGAYMTPQKIEEALLNPDTIIKLATDLKHEREQRQRLELTIQEQEPKVAFANSVSAAQNSILVGDMAKLLCQNGFDMGEKRLFKWLRENEYLCKHNSRWNKPTQRSMELKVMEYSETVINTSSGKTITRFTPKITGKGQIYFMEKFGCVKSA